MSDQRVVGTLEAVLEALPAETPIDARIASTVAMCARLLECDRAQRDALADMVAQARADDALAGRVRLALTLTRH